MPGDVAHPSRAGICFQWLEVLGGKRGLAFKEPLKLQLRALGHGNRPGLSSLEGAGLQIFLLEAAVTI